MKNHFTLLVALLLAGPFAPAWAQTGGVRIGTAGAPDASAALDVASSSKGALLPRLTQAARLAMGTGGVPAPAVGLIIYQTDGAQPGFWYAASPTVWVRLSEQGAAPDGRYVQAQTAADQAGGFRLTGTGSVGALGVGTGAPAAPLHVVAPADELLRLESSGAGPHLVFARPSGGSGVVDYIGTQYGDAGRAGVLEVRGYSGVHLNGSNTTAPELAVRGGQVGVGTAAPDASAALDVSSSSRGLLPPRLSLAQRDAIASPAAGLIIFNTTSSQPNYFDGERWRVPVDVSATTSGAGATFTTPGAFTYTVPLGVNSLLVDLAGAAGGGGAAGGRGGRVQARLAVQGGQVLSVFVGGQGWAGTPTSSGGGGVISRGAAARVLNGAGSGGGYGGGGNANYGFGGGGASDLRAGGSALANRVLVAGGGGGGGLYSNAGGHGGGPAGTAGAYTSLPSGGGGGGTQTAGGAGGYTTNPVPYEGGVSGRLGFGGGAFDPLTMSAPYATPSGGGGGGYYGGGGGGIYGGQNPSGGSAGGGGSSFASAGTSGAVLTTGHQTGNGYVTITPFDTTVPAPALDAANFQNTPWTRDNATAPPTAHTTVAASRVGIGTTAPNAQLEVVLPTASADMSLKLEHRGSNLLVHPLAAGGTGTVVENTAGNLLLNPSGGNVGISRTNPTYTLDVGGSIYASGAVISLSDARFKQNVQTLRGALAGVRQLRGVRYQLNALGRERGGAAGEQVGLLAQELEMVYPELVSTDQNGYKAINYAQLAPVLIEALKEQQTQLEELRAQVAAQASDHAALQAVKARAEADHADLQTLQAQMARLLGETTAIGTQARR